MNAQRLKTTTGVKKEGDTVSIECAKEGIPGFYELPGESVCAKATEMLQLSKVWTQTVKSRGDVMWGSHDAVTVEVMRQENEIRRVERIS